MNIQTVIDEIKTIGVVADIDLMHYRHVFTEGRWLFKKNRIHEGFIARCYGIKLKFDFEIVNQKFVKFYIQQDDIDTSFGVKLFSTDKLEEVLGAVSSALGGAILI